MDYRTYRVSKSGRQPLLEFIIKAIEASGGEITRHTSADEAPFRIAFETPEGERMGIIAYAFLANQVITRNRPADEHRFQVKYGPDTKEFHHIWQDPFGLYTTLFLGINVDQRFFVGVDPQMHNPTRFYISIEFKDDDAQAILKKGWHAWERTKRSGSLDEPVEVLVGGVSENFLQYVRFERAAHNLDQGHRQLLAERMELLKPRRLPSQRDLPQPAPDLSQHPLLRELGMPPERLLETIAGARRLKMAVRGWVAEEHLVDSISKVPGVADLERIREEGGADVKLRYRGGRALTIECKNVLRRLSADNLPRLDFQRTRASKQDPCSRYYAPEDFELVAACLHAVTEHWEFRYNRTVALQQHKSCIGKLASNVRIDASWNADVAAVLEAASSATGRL